MDMKTSRALEQLRQANYVKGAFHDLFQAPIMIEGMPIITVEGQKYLDELRSARWKITWRTILGFGAIVGIVYSFSQLLHSCSSSAKTDVLSATPSPPAVINNNKK
jgi:hypothetical protein